MSVASFIAARRPITGCRRHVLPVAGVSESWFHKWHNRTSTAPTNTDSTSTPP
jgi:hypothetical protein